MASPAFFPGHPPWSFQALRAMSQIPTGGCDYHELVRAFGRMVPGDADSWHRELSRLAARVEATGRAALAEGRRFTARDALLRAANYYRWSEFFLPPGGPERLAVYGQVLDCFHAGTALLEPPAEWIAVPYEGTTLPGYVLHPPRRRPGERSPVVIRIGGADSTKEEVFFNGALGLAERGAAVVCVDMPGMGEALRLQNLYSRPDYEVPVAAVIAALAGRDDLDLDRLGVWAASFGGYYGARAAAMDPRIRSLVIWGANFRPQHDIFDYFPPIRDQLTWLLGAADHAEARERLAHFDLSGVAERIRCPVLICHGSEDRIVRPEAAQRLYDAVRGPKELRWWTPETGGAVHCMLDNLTEAMPFMLDWLVAHL